MVIQVHICIISPEFPPDLGGVGNYVNKLSSNLINKGFKVTVLTRGKLKSTIEQPSDNLMIYRTSYLPIYPFNLKWHSYFISNLIKNLENEIDLINIHSPGPMMVRSEIPIVSTIHISLRYAIRSTKSKDLESIMTKILSPFYINLEDKLIKNSKVITAVSESISTRVKETFPYHKIRIVENGVDTDLFKPSINGLKDEYILYTGRLVLNKGVHDLIDAFYLASKKYPELKLIITGKGSYERQLINKVKNYKLDNVNFVGIIPQNELIDLYQRASIYVLPSYFEGLPTSLLEAMACESACIATDADGSRDLINDGYNGLLVPPGRPDAICDRISILMDDYRLRKNLGKNARRYVLDNYNWNKITNNMIDAYNECLSN